jgi:hypothetical protein
VNDSYKDISSRCNLEVEHNILTLKNNQFITSFDKEMENDKESFIKASVQRISANKKIKIKKQLYGYCFSIVGKNSWSSLNKILGKLKDKIQESLDVTAYLKQNILFKNIVELLFNHNELQIISKNNVNVNQIQKEKTLVNEYNIESILDYLTNTNMRDEKNRKILKYFINNYF